MNKKKFIQVAIIGLITNLGYVSKLLILFKTRV
jgi:hypothetical protein